MRFLLGMVALVTACAPRAQQPAAVAAGPVEPIGASVLDEPVVCPKPPEDLDFMAEVFADYGDTPCDDAACSRPLSVVVRNPNEVPFFVIETQVLHAEGRGAMMVEYDPPVFVPPDASIEMPRRPVVTNHHGDLVRALYLDGWGNERFVVAPIEGGEPLLATRRQEHGAGPCKATAPPLLEPLTLEASPTFSIHLHNPNAHRVRIVDLYVNKPDRSTIAPACEDAELHYVEPHASVRLPYHIDFDQVGRHVFRISVQDGWGRRHELRAPVDVSATELRARDAAIWKGRTATVPADEGSRVRR
jgi:hypothetical protein